MEEINKMGLLSLSYEHSIFAIYKDGKKEIIDTYTSYIPRKFMGQGNKRFQNMVADRKNEAVNNIIKLIKKYYSENDKLYIGTSLCFPRDEISRCINNEIMYVDTAYSGSYGLNQVYEVCNSQ